MKKTNKVLVACEFSGIVRDAFKEEGLHALWKDRNEESGAVGGD